MNAALAIYQSENAARNAVDASPIRFQFQQKGDGWNSSSWQDIVSEGAIGEASRRGDIQTNKDVVGGCLTGNGESIHVKELSGEPEHQADYPQGDSPEIEGNASVWPEILESRYLADAPGKELKSSKAAPYAPSETSAPTAGSSPATNIQKKKKKKLTTTPAQELAAVLAKEIKASAPSQKVKGKEERLPPVREFELSVEQSIFNHQAYIERQNYYAGFNPDPKTIMAEDLKGRVPLEGYLDCSLKKPDVPLRIRLRRQEAAMPHVSLMELWEKGKKERGER